MDLYMFILLTSLLPVLLPTPPYMKTELTTLSTGNCPAVGRVAE